VVVADYIVGSEFHESPQLDSSLESRTLKEDVHHDTFPFLLIAVGALSSLTCV
jgi:hypothetical protein